MTPYLLACRRISAPWLSDSSGKPAEKNGRLLQNEFLGLAIFFRGFGTNGATPFFSTMCKKLGQRFFVFFIGGKKGGSP